MSGSYLGNNKFMNKKQQNVYSIYNKQARGSSITERVVRFLPPIIKNFEGKTQNDFGIRKENLDVKEGDKLIEDENRNYLKQRKYYTDNKLQLNIKNNSDENSNYKFNKKTDDTKLLKKHSKEKQDNKIDTQKIISVDNPPKKDDEKSSHLITIDNPLVKVFVSDDDLFVNEQDDQEENETLINFMTNLDFGKYLKDLHIREALHLIRNKIEKQAELEGAQAVENLNLIKDIESQVIPSIVKNETIKPYYTNLVSHDQEWNNSIKLTTSESFKNKDEQMKTEIADKILKSENKFRSVHSVQSVKRLLDREGITGKINNINPLKIAVLKETAIIRNYNHISTMLPNMRDLPLI